MRAIVGTSWAALLIAGLVGCGGKESDTADVAPTEEPVAKTDATQDVAATPAKQPLVTTEGPREIVEMYLGAVKMGDAEITTALLTSYARQQAEISNIDVTPPGNTSANFEVGRMEYVNEAKDAAHVESRWMETDETGHTQTLPSVWVLAHEEEGWRIAGVFVALFEGEPPLILDYEKPEEVVRKLELAKQEMIRRVEQQEQGAVLQAQDPNQGGTTPR
ncbi:MAG: hypothetical protein WD030_00625 [Pirellulales bacterium]